MKMLPGEDYRPDEEQLQNNQDKSVPQRVKFEKEQGAKCSFSSNNIVRSQIIILNNCTFQTLQICPLKQLDNNNDTSVLDNYTKTSNEMFEGVDVSPSSTSANEQKSIGNNEHREIELNGCTFEILNLHKAEIANSRKIVLNNCTFNDLNISSSSIIAENSELPLTERNQLSNQKNDLLNVGSESDVDNMCDINTSFSNIEIPTVEKFTTTTTTTANILHENQQLYSLQDEIKEIVENRFRAEKLNEFRNRFVKFERDNKLRRPMPSDHLEMYDEKTFETKDWKRQPENVSLNQPQEPFYESMCEINYVIKELIQKGKAKRTTKNKRSKKWMGSAAITSADQRNRSIEQFELQDPVPGDTSVALWMSSNYGTSNKTKRKGFKRMER